MSDEQRKELRRQLRGGRRARDPVRPARLPHPGLCGRVRQGRRRQVLGHGEPRRGDGRRRAPGRRRGRRHLRPLGAAHAGRGRPPHPGRGHDHAADRARRAGHLDRHVHRRAARWCWRGPMLHRALQQFLADVYWGDLDVLLLDLPPGTGDIAISVAQLVPPARSSWSPPRSRRPPRSPSGPGHRDPDPPADRRRGREHVVADRPDGSAWSCSAPAAARWSRRLSRHRVRRPAARPVPLRPRCARPATAGCRWCSPTRTAPPPTPCATSRAPWAPAARPGRHAAGGHPRPGLSTAGRHLHEAWHVAATCASMLTCVRFWRRMFRCWRRCDRI